MLKLNNVNTLYILLSYKIVAHIQLSAMLSNQTNEGQKLSWDDMRDGVTSNSNNQTTFISKKTN